MMKTPKSVDLNVPRTPWRFFLLVSKPHRKWLWLSIIVIVVTAALSTSTSYFFKLIIDAVEAGDATSAMKFGLLYPAAILGIQLLYRLSGYTGMKVTTKVSKQTTDFLLGYILHHNNDYFANRFAGSITNKIRNVSGAFDSIIPDFLWSQLDALVSFIVTFLFIAFVDIKAALVFILLLVVLALVNKIMAKQKMILSKENAEIGTKLQGGISDVISNMSAVRQYAKANFELLGLKKISSEKMRSSQANWQYTEKLLLTNVLIIFVFALVMFGTLVTSWDKGNISTGEFVLVLALVSQITGVMVFIGRAVNATARTIGELKEGLEDVLRPYDLVDENGAKPLLVDKGLIVCSQVGFKYEENTVFTDFSLTIKPEERVGLVGHSGAGKSTFLALLLRQADLQSGFISIDGQNIKDVTQESLRRAIAIVPQEPVLFHRTLRENIAYSRPEAPLAKVEEVAKKAYAHEFIMSLEKGYDTLVGERGVKLSGGQKQRIAIARAMLKNAPILILDEATSALDSESEVEIQKALHILMKGKTVIAIAHRLSTLREMDRIIVLKDGRIVEDGTHELLKKAGGIYQKLWQHQAGGFLTN